MPGLQGDSVVAALGSPIKKTKLSLRFFHKKEAKRALDFSEPHAEEHQPEDAASAGCEQLVPASGPSSPLIPCEKKETLVPFVGLNNLGNTCYLNSILQVLYYCPGLRDGIKKLYNVSKRKDKPKDEDCKSEETGEVEDVLPAHMELLNSFHSLITSAEQLQSSYLLNPDLHCHAELATPPRKLLNTLRQLNPMYEGYLQHDAQEVLQCILGNIQEASDTIRKELHSAATLATGGTAEEEDEEALLSGKRKSDTEAGNAKKKTRPLEQSQGPQEQSQDAQDGKPFTRSKRKSSSDITTDSSKTEGAEEEERQEKEGGGDEREGKGEDPPKEGKRRSVRSWLGSNRKQPSIFSKFRSLGRISSQRGARSEEATPGLEAGRPPVQETGHPGKTPVQETTTHQSGRERTSRREESEVVGLMERLFQGRLVLRTRCLECESSTERREDFQDVSVPVQEDEHCGPESSSEVSPDPKPELKTLQWAISQFASVERIVGEDKYFCETCLHYTEAERSLLFDKTPEVVTIHLKCFSANSLEMDPYAGLSKVNTPLLTPLTLSLEEWCTRPSATGGQHYQLFAVVMHSGVTISSGHYTTYVRMSDLKNTQLWPQEGGEEEEGAGGKKEEEVLEYDDGEVSFSLAKRPGRAAVSQLGVKKPSEGVALLGGQRSLVSYDLGCSKTNTDKTESSRGRRKAGGPLASPGARKEAGGGEEQGGAEQALSSLMSYEGKWLLFDDSEVHLFEEEDFLRACSPQTCSTSTPYLLFYRRSPPL
ncbi:ubiquitin carboxyl-terminal hydrolase 1 [Osmerus eperlanus]|uniref:ubiquitin carboxyl-terminal hydrolase 1 n=1 Tax=Osmerus eperlanus TaxID=29151 RepID=UPI002E12B3E2